MKKKRFLLFITVICFVLGGCCLNHEWKDATCTEPKTCIKCEKTEGEALGHEWAEATCTEPKTCSVCGETEGEALGHTEGDWNITQTATLTSNGVRVKKCTICDEIIDNQTFSKSPSVNSSGFNFTDMEFIDWAKTWISDSYDIKTSGNNVGDTNTGYPVYESGNFIGILILKDDAKGYVTAISASFTDSSTGVAFEVLTAYHIDSNFDTDAALKGLVYNKSYTSCGMDLVTGEIDGLDLTILSPEGSLN